MAYDKIVDSSKLDSEMTQVAKIIRSKTGKSDPLQWPRDFVTAINSINAGSRDQSTLDALISREVIEVKTGARIVGKDVFSFCSSLKKVDLTAATSIEAGSFTYTSKLDSLIIRSNTICVLRDIYAFQGSNIWGGGTGSIYVPKALVSAYMSSTNWSSMATYLFKAIEDYPQITGG